MNRRSSTEKQLDGPLELNRILSGLAKDGEGPKLRYQRIKTRDSIG